MRYRGTHLAVFSVERSTHEMRSPKVQMFAPSPSPDLDETINRLSIAQLFPFVFAGFSKRFVSARKARVYASRPHNIVYTPRHHPSARSALLLLRLGHEVRASQPTECSVNPVLA